MCIVDCNRAEACAENERNICTGAKVVWACGLVGAEDRAASLHNLALVWVQYLYGINPWASHPSPGYHDPTKGS